MLLLRQTSATSSVAEGSADTVCPRSPLTLTFDRLTLKLVSESHQKWGTFLPNLGTIGLWVRYVRDGRTDRRTDKSNAYCPLPYSREHNKRARNLGSQKSPAILYSASIQVDILSHIPMPFLSGKSCCFCFFQGEYHICRRFLIVLQRTSRKTGDS